MCKCLAAQRNSLLISATQSTFTRQNPHQILLDLPSNCQIPCFQKNAGPSLLLNLDFALLFADKHLVNLSNVN